MREFWNIGSFVIAVEKFVLATTMLLFMPGVCAAQEESLTACLEKLATVPGFAILADKVALGAGKDTTPRMLADPSLANNTERPVIGKWAAARADCLKANSRFGNQVYRPPLQAFSMDAENKIMAAVVELYDLKISYGEFNRRRQAIDQDLREKTAQLGRQIQQQGLAYEQADRVARERDRMQRDIEEAERQATQARQQAEQAQENSAPVSRRQTFADAPRRYQSAPITVNRNCYRFGGRITCTN